jgi:hypothetical protein
LSLCVLPHHPCASVSCIENAGSGVWWMSAMTNLVED